MKIVAIGGGGFTHQTVPELDDFVLHQSSKGDSRFGYIGTANEDMPERINRFYERFHSAPLTLSHLPQSASTGQAAEWISQQDIIYVGGGNTAHLLDVWRTTGIGKLLQDAAQKGIVLAGVSAGAVCWFEVPYSTSDGKKFRPLTGLGLINGSCTPHYSSESARPPAFSSSIARGDLPDGIAIDDGAAVLFENGQPLRVFSAVQGAGAYRVRKTEIGVSTTPIPELN